MMSSGKELLFSLLEKTLSEHKTSSRGGISREEPVLDELAFTGRHDSDLGVSGISTPHIVDKRWGGEKIYQNNELYCGKLLTINPHSCTSMHYHIEKHETMINIGKGILYIDYIVNKEKETAVLKQWESFVIAPGLPHRLRAEEEEVNLIEASTPSYDADSIRLPEEK